MAHFLCTHPSSGHWPSDSVARKFWSYLPSVAWSLGRWVACYIDSFDTADLILAALPIVRSFFNHSTTSTFTVPFAVNRPVPRPALPIVDEGEAAIHHLLPQSLQRKDLPTATKTFSNTQKIAAIPESFFLMLKSSSTVVDEPTIYRRRPSSSNLAAQQMSGTFHLNR